MNIALYGGSFDPPHLGHMHVVTAALDTLDIDKLIIVPAFVNPFKTGTHAPAELRFKWLREIFKANKKVEITDFEVTQNRAVRSIETVKHFDTLYKEIYFIIGADNLASLQEWHHYDALDKLVTWVVATRDNIEIDEKYIQLSVDHPISSSELREELNEEHLPNEVALEIKTFYETNKETHARSH